MLTWTFAFLVIAIITTVFDFGETARDVVTAAIAKVIFFIISILLTIFLMTTAKRNESLAGEIVS